MEKEVSIDSNGYYIGDDLTPEQEQHNLNLDEQIAQGETEWNQDYQQIMNVKYIWVST